VTEVMWTGGQGSRTEAGPAPQYLQSAIYFCILKSLYM